MLGKDYLFARLILWWLYTRRDSLVIVTGPTQNQIGSIVWKEVRRAIRRAPIRFAASITAAVQASPQQVVIAGGWQALGFSTKSVERASGQHAGELLVLVIEGSGVEPEIWEAIDSLGAQRMAINGNPIRADGRMVELIRQAEKDKVDRIDPELAVNAIKIPSTDSPHANMDHSPVGLADKTWLEKMWRRYGKNSLWCRSHINADIPEVSSERLIPDAWLDWAASRPARLATPVSHPINGTRRISCDLGEGVGRDSSAIIVRDDWGVLEVIWGASLGLPEAADRIKQMRDKWSVPDERISYDKVGIGRDFYLHLSRRGITGAVGYAGAAAPQSGDFTNLRSEAAFKLRQRLDPLGADDHRQPHKVRPDFIIPPGPYWQRMRAEFQPLTYSLAMKGKTALLAKDKWAEALGHSPDLADALIQSFAF
jgi:hypothetical protein